MRRILLVFMLAMSICGSVFANAQEVVNSFKTFVTPKVAQVEATYAQAEPTVKYREGDKYIEPYYSKSTQNFEYALDVQSTDSLMSPYIGIIELKQTITNYQKHSTPEAAMAETQVSLNFITRYKLVYNYDNGNWVFAKATMFDDNMGDFPTTYSTLGESDESWYKMVSYSN